ncbi:hypothetical protein [Candidatus Lariskella endosymbiont of Hedychridium roseum]|uniref:hypothetical protein n=1 Tax=Candidatus Lariskella endosymbiont of Hedychridium roseum TaxID=3077949 RepID=UPI0030CFC00D
MREALKRADLALENSRIPDITDLDMTILSGLLAGVNMGQIQTQLCTNIPLLPNNCNNKDLSQLDDSLAILTDVGQMAGCANCPDDEMVAKINAMVVKSTAFDMIFPVVAGKQLTGNVDDDVESFIDKIPTFANYAAAFVDIGKNVLDNPDYNPSSMQELSEVAEAVGELKNYKTQDISWSTQTLNKLGVAANDPSANSEKVYSEVQALADALTSFGSKIGMTSASYSGAANVKLSQLFSSEEIVKKMGMIIPYQKMMAGVKEGCRMYMMCSNEPDTNQKTLGDACKAFVAMKEPGPGLKDVCLAVYGPTGVDPSIVVAPLATGVSPNTNGRSTVSGAGVSRAIAESCASIADGHFYNVDGTTLIPSIGGATQTGYGSYGTSTLWTSFNGAPSNFWDQISSSHYAWIDFSPFA